MALPSVTRVLAGALPRPCAITGTRQLSGFLSGRSLVNSPWLSFSVVRPPLHAAASTRISGMPGCRVKSCAIAVIGLPATACTSRHRSSDWVLP